MSEPIEAFCVGLAGRKACSTCAGKLTDEALLELRREPRTLPARRIALHQPWPFDPCPHYVAPVTAEVAA